MDAKVEEETRGMVADGEMDAETRGGLPRVDPERDVYPFCIVWTPIPGLTWLLPFVGHMGVCDSAGVTHDFAGPYFCLLYTSDAADD